LNLSAIRLKNFGPFRGEHLLELRPTAYGVTARSEKDPERSNWLGKSFFLSAVGFVLVGEHLCDTEDEWISEGEKEGEAGLLFDTGTWAIRSRRRGDSTQLQVKEGERILAKGPAQDRVFEMIGLAKEDLFACSFFEQKTMDRLVLATPEDRTTVLTSWLGLDPLIACHEREKDKAAFYAEKLAAAEQRVARWRDDAAQDADGARARVEELSANVDALVLLAQMLTEKAAVSRARLAEAEAVTDFETEEAKLEELEAIYPAQPDADPALLQKKVVEKTAEVRERETAERRLKIVAAGAFDGTCPLVQASCPARNFIDDARQGAATAAKAEAAKAETLRAALAKLEKAHTAAQAASQALRRHEERVSDLRKRQAARRPRYEQAQKSPKPEDGDVEDRLRDATAKCRDAMTALAGAKAAVERADLAKKEHTAAVAEADVLRARLVTVREAMAVFGRQGAQRKVAEDAVSDIEGDANATLSESGIDLQIRARWEREGKGLAPTCDSCGEPYPASAKVKLCPRCGVGRGPNVVSKLDLRLSNRSGAAEDLAGLAFGLAGGAYLRRARGSAWGVVLLDEPFGHLDGAHRKALSRHLTKLLLSPRSGVEQAFVIAHHASVIDALPARIEITSDGKWSRAEVA
jgi:DNA repair exonuclease SbcCD ATPase subunit